MFKFNNIYILYILWIGCFYRVESSPQEMAEMFMNTAKTCVPKVGASDADVDNLLNGRPLTTREGKCLHACVMMTLNLLNDDGKMVKSVALEHAKAMLNENDEMLKAVIEIIDICTSLNVSDDHCDAADEYANCFKDNTASRGVEAFSL